jgi:hypothetical protein
MNVPQVTPIYPGQVFMVPSGQEGLHLFVSVLEAKVINGRRHVLLASVCSMKDFGLYNDETCVIQPGEHPFVKKPSFIHYGLLRSEPEQAVLDSLANGYYVARSDAFSSELLRRVADGVAISKHVKRYIKDDWL